MSTELEKHLPKPIKEVIAEFPAFAGILDQYEIACGTCLAGDCLFKDIVSVHNLPPDSERELMERLAGVLAPSAQAAPPPPAAVRPQKTEERVYSPPMKMLVDEHVLIKQWLALIPGVIEKMDLSSAEGREVIAGGVDFIRLYADQLHHGKEEKILFGYFDEKTEIIRAMLSDHETGRGHVKTIREALARGDRDAIAAHLLAYRELLSAHIRKEDEILFPWMDRGLSDSDKRKLMARFAAADGALEEGLAEKCKQFIAGLQ